MLAGIFPWTKECDVTYEKLTDYTNNSTREKLFPDSLKRGKCYSRTREKPSSR